MIRQPDLHVCICGARVLKWDENDMGCTWMSTNDPKEQGCWSLAVDGDDGPTVLHLCSEECCEKAKK